MKKQANVAMSDNTKSTFGYTNDQNPFGDANLTKAFVWRKKYEKERAIGVDPKKLTKGELRAKQLALRDEIERVRSRRTAREEEKALMEEMRVQLQRDIDTSVAEDWEEKEEEFHRQQAKLRSVIRIKEGREKPIDILAKNLSHFHNDEMMEDAEIPIDIDVELTEPHKIFNGLSERDLLVLRTDIKVHVDLGSDLEYWGSLLMICEDEILKEKHKKGIGAYVRENRNRYGLHQSVQGDVNKMLEGKKIVVN